MKLPKTKKTPKPLTLATPRLRSLRSKLEALALYGIDGERDNAQRKLGRLVARVDWTAKDAPEAGDILNVAVTRAAVGHPIGEFDCPHVANAVRWAVEQRTGAECYLAGAVILARVTPDSARRLQDVARTIAEGFATTWTRFAGVPGVCPGDRPLFCMGLYDGMMLEQRAAGQRLPSRPHKARPIRAKRGAVDHAPAVNLHPYTLALSLGRSIRFSVHVVTICEQLDRMISGELPAPAA